MRTVKQKDPKSFLSNILDGAKLIPLPLLTVIMYAALTTLLHVFSLFLYCSGPLVELWLTPLVGHLSLLCLFQGVNILLALYVVLCQLPLLRRPITSHVKPWVSTILAIALLGTLQVVYVPLYAGSLFVGLIEPHPIVIRIHFPQDYAPPHDIPYTNEKQRVEFLDGYMKGWKREADASWRVVGGGRMPAGGLSFSHRVFVRKPKAYRDGLSTGEDNARHELGRRYDEVWESYWQEHSRADISRYILAGFFALAGLGVATAILTKLHLKKQGQLHLRELLPVEVSLFVGTFLACSFSGLCWADCLSSVLPLTLVANLPTAIITKIALFMAQRAECQQTTGN